ncbi:NAD(P)H-hydrate dehydratase [Amedibacillus sp. YH-ame10]
MFIVSTKDMRALDQIAISDYLIPSLQLMKQAACTLKTYIDENYHKEDCICIVCGPGNNGGDGFALASILQEDGYAHIRVLCNVEETSLSQDAMVYAQRWRETGNTIEKEMEIEHLCSLLARQDLIVDALYGTGLSRPIQGKDATMIQAITESGVAVLSVDIPSGIHSDTGEVMGCAIKATTTITFACATLGQFIYPGSQHCGTMYIKSIGIPSQALQKITTYSILEDSLAKEMLPIRKAHSHKGSYGKVLLIGGSVSMHGALTLCAKSMLRSGVGILTLFLPDVIVPVLSQKIEECMLVSVPSNDGFFAPNAIDRLKECIQDYDMIVIGNGMGRGKNVESLVSYVLQQELPCVIDGDAIYECAKHLDLLKQRSAPTILTPHPKEMSYLTNLVVQDIVKDPFTIVKQFANEYHAVVALKDQYTYISDGKELYVNTAGNHSLAKGGSGDVLCGIIAGLFAQSKQALPACACGVYVHAKCADELLKREDGNSILPSDLIDELSSVYQSIR